MTFIAVISGADSWNDIQEDWIAKEDWMTKLLNLQNAIPSHDTFNRVISRTDHKEFERCFMEWTALLAEQTQKREIISIDGKTICEAKEHGNKSPVHIASAWACENNIVLGEVKTNEKSNEMKAIPELLDLLFIENRTLLN